MGKWEMVRLGDVCTLKSGTSLSNEILSNKGEIPYVKVGDMNLQQNASYINMSSNYVARQDIEKQIFPVGTVIFPKRGGAIGTNKKRLTSREICADLNIMGIIPSEKLLSSYLYSFFQTIDLASLQNGSSVPQINNGDIFPIEIPLPPLAIQQKIADILDRANILIEKRKTQIEKLDLLVKSQFVEMFGDPVTNPMGWEVAKWDEVFNTTTGKLDSNAMIENGEYPFFTCAKEVFSIDNYAFDCEALLLAGNNAAGIYDVKHYAGKFNAYQRTYVITLKNNSFSYYPFKLMLEHKLEQMRDLSKGTNTKYLTMGILNEFVFIVPPLALQIQFAAFVEQVETQKTQFKKSLALLELNYKSLMQKCFSGKLF